MPRLNTTSVGEAIGGASVPASPVAPRPRQVSGRSHATSLETGLFVAVDDSVASVRAVEYVAGFVRRRSGFRICLVRVLPPLPAELLEHGGAYNSADEARIEEDLQERQRKWISGAKLSSEKELKEAKAILRQAGVRESYLQTIFCEPGEARDAADSILHMAREHNCHTIVVGRGSASHLPELFSQELAEELLRRGKGFSVWVVE